MRTRTALFGLALLSATPSMTRAQTVPPVDSLALARQYTEWLFAGEADSLAAHVRPGTQDDFGTPAYWTSAHGTIASRAGEEVAVLDESWMPRNGDCQYWRTSEFSLMNEWLLIRWVLDEDGRIAGLGMGPESQAPPVDGETCGTPRTVSQWGRVEP